MLTKSKPRFNVGDILVQPRTEDRKIITEVVQGQGIARRYYRYAGYDPETGRSFYLPEARLARWVAGPESVYFITKL